MTNAEAFEAGVRKFYDRAANVVFSVKRSDALDTNILAGKYVNPGDYILYGSGSTRAVSPREFEVLEPVEENEDVQAERQQPVRRAGDRRAAR